MLTKRIISCLDIKEGRVVKGVHFINLKDAGDPLKNAKFYEKEGADELVFLDITASHEKRSTTIDLVKEIARVVFMPFTVGGGIKNVSDIRKLLLAGAEKVSLNTSAVKNPQLISEAGKIFGKQCIVVAIDAKLRRDTTEGSPEYPRGARYDRRKSRVSPRGAIRKNGKCILMAEGFLRGLMLLNGQRKWRKWVLEKFFLPAWIAMEQKVVLI